jgi:hypothetical protein
VRGQLDAQTVRTEVERMLDQLRQGLAEHQTVLHTRMGATLRDYFDPQSGRFAERVDKLTHEDGELAAVIRNQVSGDSSALVRTLKEHLGPESPLLKLVDPANAEGLLPSIGELVSADLEKQRERILAEFSLDNKQGSLARLVTELQESHGKLTGDLSDRITEVVQEFSLDDPESALSRLVQRVETAQRQITDEFSLDSDSSALARLRRELMEVTSKQTEQIQNMQQTVAREMAALAARRETEQRSTAHGDDFEDQVAAQLQRSAQRSGDLFERTGRRVGQIKNRKVGDCVIELGPEHQAAGARIVVEAKEERGVTLAKAREELELARKNRGAEHGIFVFSAAVAPEGLPALERIGPDLYVIWDRDDPSSDLLLEGALSVARALCTRLAQGEQNEVDFAGLERAIRDVEKQAVGLDEIKRSAQTIETSSERILNRVRIMGKNLATAIETLDAGADAARRALGD